MTFVWRAAQQAPITCCCLHGLVLVACQVVLHATCVVRELKLFAVVLIPKGQRDDYRRCAHAYQLTTFLMDTYVRTYIMRIDPPFRDSR